MKYIIFIASLLFSTVALANPIDDKCAQFIYAGAPESKLVANEQYLCKLNYAVHYRYDTKTAEYVVEHVTKESINGSSKRKNDFRPDSSVPVKFQSQLADYATAGNIYDRGHLSPAGDNTISDAIMSESFFLTNMVPQVANNNRGIWKQLETAVRNWSLAGKDVYVVSGTIYDPGFKTIGPNTVGVPTKLFKVIYDKTNNRAIGFIFPNQALPVKDLPNFAMAVSDVEKQTGLVFMPKLPAEVKSTKPNLADWTGLN